MKKATAYANANIALIKYWGKQPGPLNIPAVSSLSMTLRDLGCTVSLSPHAHAHSVTREGQPVNEQAHARTCAYLELIRTQFSYDGYFHVATMSNLPFAAGLASSAAYFAALATAINEALSLDLSTTKLSILARMGSGSAARSIFGSFAALKNCATSGDAWAYPIDVPQHFTPHLVVAVIDDTRKPISSRDAMNHTTATSPFFARFVETHHEDFSRASKALTDADLVSLGEAMEHSTLKMFATMWTAKPAIHYWQPNSLAIIETIYRLRREHGPIAFFTMDAGPNVKVLCEEPHLALVLRAIASAKVTKNIFCVTPGDGARVIA